MEALLPDKGTACLFHGVCNEARAALVTTLAKQNQSCTSLLIVNNLARAQELATEIETYAEWLLPKQKLEVLFFPEEPLSDMDTNQQADRIYERLIVLRTLLSAKKETQLVVSTPAAILGVCPDRGQFESRQIELVRGKNYLFKELVETLIQEFDYDAEALCEYPGQVATRGGLIDVYPYDANQPYRLDFFGDTLESIRSFDPTSQRTANSVLKITLSAAGTVQSLKASEGNFVKYLDDGPIAWIFEEPSKLVHDHPMQFSHTAPAGNSVSTFDHIFKVRGGNEDLRTGICLVDTSPKLFDQERRVELSTETITDYRLYPDTIEAGLDRFESEQSARKKFDDTLVDWAKKERRTLYFAAASESDAEQIAKDLAENPATAKLKPRYLQGTLSGGFLCKGNPAWLPLKQTKTSSGIALVTESEYFGRQNRKIKRIRERARPTISQVDQLLDFSELTDGDSLVHLQHGVCIFRGLSTIEMQGGFKEMITVEFAEQMTLHVPLNESHLLTRYVSLAKARPKLNKIGTSAWEKTRKEAEIATLDYASELLSLHAKRSHNSGYAFPAEHPWQLTFERAFPFTETPDQLSAIEATKADMETGQPMDRLICGDVGFGKTEVALRAALKAVLAGKQVALLTPTTVLCQQHFNTFCERLAPYPIIIDSVSRF
ncbi:MAG: transcription-repair coupling factor (superfamily II helicase), partial [Lentimonas sp.]